MFPRSSSHSSRRSPRGMLPLSQLPVWTKLFGAGAGRNGCEGVDGPLEAVPVYDGGGLWKVLVVRV